MYEQNYILSDLGGRWRTKKEKARVFASNPKEQWGGG